jgi:hypothetical protein
VHSGVLACTLEAIHACDLFAELERNAQKLVAVSSRLRAKGASAVIERLLNEDALLPSKSRMTRAEILALWLADVVLATKLKWPQPLPLLAAGLMHPSLRGAETIVGETSGDERRRIIDDFRAGRIQCLTNCNCLTTRFDAAASRRLAICVLVVALLSALNSSTLPSAPISARELVGEPAARKIADWLDYRPLRLRR